MGGLVVASFLADRRPPVAAARDSRARSLPSAPASRGPACRRRAPPIRLAPRLALGSGLDPNGLSRDPDVVRRYVEDPLVQRNMTAALGSELLAPSPRTAARAAEVQVPVLMLHGAEDPMCPIEGSAAFHGGLQVPGCAFRAYPALRHEIFNEPEHEQVFADVLDWVERTLRREEPGESRPRAASA